MDQRPDGRAPRRRLAAAERREAILRAAAAVFAQAGYRATRVSDVAARVGVTEPVIFQHFGSKAALFAAVLERAAGQARAWLDELAAGSGSASGLLGHVLTQLAGGEPAAAAAGDPGAGYAGPGHGGIGPKGTGHPGPGHTGICHAGTEHTGAGHPGTAYGVLFADAAALIDEPGLIGPGRDALRAVAAHLADLIRAARADGGVSPQADPEAAAWLLLSVLSARRLRAAAMPAGLEPAVTALALRALAPPAGWGWEP